MPTVTTYPGVFGPYTPITFTRASTGTYFDSAGTLTTAAINEARLDYDPSTLTAQGFLVEEARTNSIRNNTMQGAVAGTPGTLPTNWGVSGLGTLTQQVVGTGTVNGITYIDLRFSGTTSTTSVSIRHEPSGTGGVAAVNGQTWSQSAWTAVVAGSTANITQAGLSANIFDSGGAFLSSIPYTNFIANTTSTLTRVTPSGTIASVGTAFIQPQIYLTFSSGVAIDITLRIGLPQLELGAFATSVIPTTTTALTRSADVASVNTLSPWFNASASTIFAEYTILTARTSDPTFARIDDGSDANRYQVATGASFTVFNSFAIVSNVSQGGNTVSINPLGTHKIAFAVTTNDSVAAADGTVGTPDTTVTLPSGLTRFSLGNGNLGAFLNGYLRRITYYPRRLSNAELQAITA